MDEALRRAYLAAMEIPVWIPRDEADPWDGALDPAPVRSAVEATAARAAPASAGPPLAQTQPGPPPQVARSGDRRAQALLGELNPAPTRARPAAEVAAPAQPVSMERFSLLFASAGGTLFIDDSSGERPSRRVFDLLSALVFVLEHEQLRPEPHPFIWPPHAGRATAHAGHVRDAVLGRIMKFSEGMALKRLVLMGETPLQLLFGEEVLGRGPRVLRLERPECLVLAVPSLARMLADPDAKRLAWQTLRLAHG